MKKIVIVCFSILMLGSENIFSQNLSIPYSEKARIDGKFELSEWSDADSIEIEINSGVKSKVFFMHDSSRIYFAFVNNLSSGGNYFPELVFDTELDSASSFQSDDWWFHVSATDCEYQGQYGNYANCSMSRPNWTAMPNFGGRTVDTVEIEIPMDSIDLGVSDTFGLGFILNNFRRFQYYPTSLHHFNPRTFLPASFASAQLSTLQEVSYGLNWKVYPSPSKGLVHLLVEGQENVELDLSVTNLVGQIVFQRKDFRPTRGQAIQLQLEGVSPGIYFVSLRKEQQVESKKIIIQ